MSALQAIPTPHGIEILNSELKNTVTKYQLVGALTHDAASETLYPFHTATIETSYYDENGVLTFILNLPIETHFDKYLHRIDVLDSQNQAVIECPTPKIALAKGIGGIVTLKAAIKGQAGDVVFKHGEYLTETELLELHLAPIRQELRNFVGLIGEFHDSSVKEGWVDLRGGELSRATDKLLWDYAVSAGMVIAQTTKDADPMTHAMKFGDGDGATTFTLPNHHLGHFVRGTPNGVNHGETQASQNKSHGHKFKNIYGSNQGEFSRIDGRIGSTTSQDISSDSAHFATVNKTNTASLSFYIATEGSDEARPNTANLSIKIHRGWM